MSVKPAADEGGLRRSGRRIAVPAAFWIGLWALAAFRVGKDLILPGPVSVLKSLAGLAATADFWLFTALTLLRIIGGYLAGLAAGVLLAAASCASRLLDTLISPLMRVIRATPVASFIILALLWMGKSAVPLLMAALMTAPVVFGNICEAYQKTDPALIEMGRHYRIGRGRMLTALYIPSASPAFRAAALTTVGLAWKAGIAAEVLSQPSRAIGTNLYYSKIYLETPALFAWTAAVIILSFLLEKVMQYLIGSHLVNRRAKGRAGQTAAGSQKTEREAGEATDDRPKATQTAGFLPITIHDISFAYPEKPVFDHFSTQIGTATAIMGPSGCGKTTLLRLIAGLETPQGGEIALGPRRAVMMFQEDRLLPHMSAFENVALVLPTGGKARAARLLQDLGVDGNLMPGALSGGMARRVALARALAVPSDILLLDEPFKGLDPELISRASDLIRREGRLILAATHSEAESDRIGEAVLRLEGIR